ncbi:MAG: hypothetical protein ACRENX_02280 [Candidatus Dormibacteria bacterium]
MDDQTGVFRPPPRGIGALLDTVFSLYRRNFWLLLAAAAVIQVPYQVLTSLLQLGFSKEPASLSQFDGGQLTNGQVHQFLDWSSGSIGLELLLFLVFVVFLPLELAAVTTVVTARYQGQATSLGGAYRLARNRWLPLVGLAILFVGLLFALGTLVGIVVVALGFLLGVLGLILDFVVVVAGIVVYVTISVRLALSVPIVLLEAPDPWLALRRSWELSRGSGWRVLGFLCLLALIVGLAGLLAGALAGAISVALGGTGQLGGRLLIDLSTLLVGVVATPLYVAGLVLLYFDLLSRREGLGPVPAAVRPAYQG